MNALKLKKSNAGKYQEIFLKDNMEQYLYGRKNQKKMMFLKDGETIRLILQLKNNKDHMVKFKELQKKKQETFML